MPSIRTIARKGGALDCGRYGDILHCRNRQCREEPRLIELAAFMVSAAKKAKRVQTDTRKPENEKYYLRMWLLRIGMGTKASHESRMVLLKGLNGWSAFRTEEEAMTHARKQKERRHQNL